MRRQITKRFVLHVGYSCNERCIFCYYRDSLEKGKVKDLSLDEIKKRLRIGRKYGKNAVDLSGGEPTIREDIYEIIEYAKKVGYERICIITNGLLLNDKVCSKLKKAGLNDVLFSLHSSDPKIHDALTQVPGSWKKLINAMQNMKDLGVSARINTVVNNLNYDKLDHYFSTIKKYNPDAVNLLIFNPAEETIHIPQIENIITDYNLIGSNILKAFKKYEKNFKKINIRFLPFCMLKGHEEKIRTMWQKIYEKVEWDPILFMKFRKNNLYLTSSFFLGIIFSLFKNHYFIPYNRKKSNLYTLLCEVIQSSRIFYNKKHVKECKKCAFRKICPGLHRTYIKNFNKKIKLKPYPGELIKDPLHFMPKEDIEN